MILRHDVVAVFDQHPRDVRRDVELDGALVLDVLGRDVQRGHRTGPVSQEQVYVEFEPRQVLHTDRHVDQDLQRQRRLGQRQGAEIGDVVAAHLRPQLGGQAS